MVMQSNAKKGAHMWDFKVRVYRSPAPNVLRIKYVVCFQCNILLILPQKYLRN